MRKTSLEALLKLLRSKRLSLSKQRAAEALARFGPLTGQELSRRVKWPGIWKRLSEMKRIGLVVEDCVRKCRVTGHSALAWRLRDQNDADPSEPKKKRKFWLLICNGTVLDVHKSKPKSIRDSIEVVEVQEFFSRRTAIQKGVIERSNRERQS